MNGEQKAHEEAIAAAQRIHEDKSRGLVIVAELGEERVEIRDDSTNRQAEGVVFIKGHNMRGVEILETLIGVIESQVKISRLQLIQYIAKTYHDRASVHSTYPSSLFGGFDKDKK